MVLERRFTGDAIMIKPTNLYVSTKWIIAFFFPIFPLGSYRVIKEKQAFLTGHFPRYRMTPVPLNRRQVVYTYLAWWGPRPR